MAGGMGTEAWLGEQRKIDEMAREVEEIWRKTRPNIMRLYASMQQVAPRTQEAAKLWKSSAELFCRNGVSHDQANNLAMYEFVYLPDIEQSEEAEILESLRKRADAG